jgi:heme A synthase
LERGDFKLRVRASELERAEERNKLVQSNMLQAVISCLFLQGFLTTSTVGKGLKYARPVSQLLLGTALFFAVKVPLGLMKVRNLDKYNERYGVKR